jgi:glycine oxidase
MQSREDFQTTADAIVIGGGVAGLTVATALGQRGLSVVVIERERPGAEASAAAAGMLAPQAEADCADSFFQLAAAARDYYPAYAAMLREETGLDIELDQTGTLYLAFTGADENELEHRYAWQAGAGMSVERLTAAEVLALEPAISSEVRMALRFPHDGQVENRRLIAALIALAEARRVRLMSHTVVTALRIESERVRGVETSRGAFDAAVVVVAAGAWTPFIEVSGGSQAQLPRIEPVRGQMLCFEARPRLVRHVVYSPRGYLVPRRDGRLLAGSTSERAGLDKSVTVGGLHAITTHALEIAPRVAELPLIEAWAGLRPRAQDDLPVLGAHPGVRGLYYATGHYRNGILLAPLTGEMVAQMIVAGTTAPLVEAFGLERFHQDVRC